MDYYEELGLSPAASVEEIRQAYRQLARLIHPDQQPDDGLRRLAEIQMKRLHMMLEVLSDPPQRREYDRSLAPPAALVLIPHPHAKMRIPGILEGMRQVRWSVWVWGAAALVGIVTIAVFFSFNSATGPAAAVRASRQLPLVAAPPKPRSAQPPEVTAPLRKPSPRPAVAGSAHGPLPSPPAPELPKSPAPSAALPEPRIAVAASLPEPALPLPSVEPPGFQDARGPAFAGNWLYRPSPDTRPTAGLYPPEFIEVRIGEEDGKVWGLYRARYLVPDRAISPSVVFRFQGRATAPQSTLRWNGLGGAYGTVTLKLTSENTLEVSWIANRLSKEQGLISGMATLVRRGEP